MNRRYEVFKFIRRFTQGWKNKGVIDTFTNGCCYWFAYILYERFYDHDAWREDVDIMYDQVENHFGCRIDGFVYDIRGDVTNSYDWQEWSSVAESDKLLFQRILRDCINF